MDISLIFLGSFLTFLATFAVETLKSKSQDKKKQSTYATYAKLQLTAIRKILDKMRHSYENGGTYQQIQRDTGLLEEAIRPLNNFRNDMTTLNNGDEQSKLIDFIADLNLHRLDVVNIISSESDIEITIAQGDQASQMTTKHIELIELCRRADEIMDSLKLLAHNK